MTSTAQITNNVNTHTNKVWEHEFTAYLKDSNAYGNIYFSRYFDWQGLCREMWFSEEIFTDMFKLPGALVTHNAHNNYISPVYPFEKIRCELQTADIRQASFKLIFNFFNKNGTLVSSGGQEIAMYSTSEQKLIRVPGEILTKLHLYETKN